MPITTDRNPAYGPPLVNQKYRPLENIAFNVADQPIYTGLLNNRMTLLRGLGLIGSSLELATPNWQNVIAAEVGHNPPLVVVSSNRAQWVRTGIDIGNARLTQLGQQAFANASDLRALNGNNPQSPPLYAPSRIGPNRNVYIVVHMAEYKLYKAQMAGTGVTPVGWKFAKTAGAQRKLTLVGFGATRFAAMEFCKILRRQAAALVGGVAPWDSAWILDDNTVALGTFAGFGAVEAALGGNWCAGFHGGTLADTRLATRTWAQNQLAQGLGGQAGALPPPLQPINPQNNPRIVQQTALWNVALFDLNNFNFGPLFLASAEDLSVSNHFNNAGLPYQYYNGIPILKEIANEDNRPGAQQVNKFRSELTALVTAAESATLPAGAGAAPPPVEVLPVVQADGGVQTLSTFITTRVLPNALPTIQAQAQNPAIQALAKSHAVEQLTSGAIRAGFVNAPAVTGAFQINGAAVQQPILQRNIP